MTCWEIRNVASFFPIMMSYKRGSILTNWLIYLSFTDMWLYEWNLNIKFKKQGLFNMSPCPKGKLLFSFPFSLPLSLIHFPFQLLSNTKHHTLFSSPISNSTQCLTTLFTKYFTIQIPSTNYHLNPSYHQAICSMLQ